jgi:hypothetical protein
LRVEPDWPSNDDPRRSPCPRGRRIRLNRASGVAHAERQTVSEGFEAFESEAGEEQGQRREEKIMPSKSAKQARTMRAAAHDKAFAKKMGIPQKVAREFVKADKSKKKKRR